MEPLRVDDKSDKKQGGGGATSQELLARIGLESEAHLKAATAGSSRKKRMIEKMMVAELHHMHGELNEERATLRNENQTLKEAIERLRAAAASSTKKPDLTQSPISSKATQFSEGDVAMDEVG